MRIALWPALVLLVAMPATGAAQLPEEAPTVVRDLRAPRTDVGIEVLEQVELGGVHQWVSIRGQDRSNPVILFLHGGPGDPGIGLSWAFQKNWEEFFTVVQWDQRGGGKQELESIAPYPTASGPIPPQQMVVRARWVSALGGTLHGEPRGLDIFELVPNALLTRNEIDAAKSVVLEQLNSQGQPQFEWPNTFALARAYVDQLERSRGLSAARVAEIRQALDAAESRSGGGRREILEELADDLDMDAGRSLAGDKVRMLQEAVRGLAG